MKDFKWLCDEMKQLEESIIDSYNLIYVEGDGSLDIITLDRHTMQSKLNFIISSIGIYASVNFTYWVKCQKVYFTNVRNGAIEGVYSIDTSDAILEIIEIILEEY